MNNHATQNLTIIDLATHRTGLARQDSVWYDSSLSREELLHQLKHLEFDSDLRQKFQYNNLMYGVIGHVIERVTGQTWENTVQQRIFTPLSMKCSNFSVKDSQNADDFSYPYTQEEENIQQIPFRDISSVGPAGSINSTIMDMSKWVQLQLSDGEKMIQKKTLNEMHTLQFAKAEFPQERVYPLGYRLGWFIHQYGGHYLVEHDGCIDGFIANVSLFPKEKIGVIALSNSDDSGVEFVSSVSKSIFDRLLDLDKIDWVEKLSTKLRR